MGTSIHSNYSINSLRHYSPIAKTTNKLAIICATTEVSSRSESRNNSETPCNVSLSNDINGYTNTLDQIQELVGNIKNEMQHIKFVENSYGEVLSTSDLLELDSLKQELHQQAQGAIHYICAVV
jgi:hypothetical protein